MSRLTDLAQGLASLRQRAGRAVAGVLDGVTDGGPLKSIASLEEFVGARAAFVSQNQLYGYLKTQESGRFRDFFEDAAFSNALREAGVGLCEACLSDLSVYAAALVGRDAALSDQETAYLARRCHRAGLSRADAQECATRRQSAETAFERRLATISWAPAAEGDAAFAESPETLLSHVVTLRTLPASEEASDGRNGLDPEPVDPEFVLAAVRCKWREIRDQLARRLDAASIAAALRAATPSP